MKKLDSSVLKLRLLLSQEEKVDLNFQNCKYIFNDKVINYQKIMYLNLISWINEGLSYEEIEKNIEDFTLNDLKDIEINYIKIDAQNIINKRKIKERERMIKYE